MTADQLQIQYTEATRYMQNASNTLQNAKKEDGFYEDVKYVRSACGTAYMGAILALDALFEYKNIPKLPKRKRKSIEYYTERVAKIDKKLLYHLNIVYEILHLDGYYGGVNKASIIKDGFESAYFIIDKINPLYYKNNQIITNK